MEGVIKYYKCPACKKQTYIYNPDTDSNWHEKTEWPNYSDKTWYCKECQFTPFYVGS